MTLLHNLLIITYANFEHGCFVGSNRLLEMIATIGTNITAFQPPCIPTDWQANRIAHHKLESPHTVHFIGDDLLDLGDLNLEADVLPQSQENSRLASKLPVRSFLQL